jgi:ATP-dependent exoDNAse (exonuclease V) beta subunit
MGDHPYRCLCVAITRARDRLYLPRECQNADRMPKAAGAFFGDGIPRVIR